MLVYADSSDEEDRDEVDSQLDEMLIDEEFSMQTGNPNQRHDSLKEIVFLKDAKPGSYSFKEKQKSKRMTVDSHSKCRQIQLNSKQIAIYDQEI